MAFDSKNITERDRIRGFVFVDPIDREGFKRLPESVKKEHGPYENPFDDSRYCDFNCFNCRAVCLHNHDRLEKNLARHNNDLSLSEKWEKFHVRTPEAVWVIDMKVEQMPGAYSVPLDTIYHPRTGNWSRDKNLRRRFNIPEDSLLIFTSNQKDYMLDLWAWNMDEFAEKIAEYDFDFAFPLYFSCYNNYPRVDWMINTKLRMECMESLQRHGVNCLPHISIMPTVPEYTEKDIERWANWLVENECYVAVSGVGSKVRYPEVKKVAEDLNDLSDRVVQLGGKPVHWFMMGLSTKRLEVFREHFRYSWTVVDQKAHQNSTMSLAIGNTGMKRYGLNPWQTFAINRRIITSMKNGEDYSLEDEIALEQGKEEAVVTNPELNRPRSERPWRK